MRATRRAVHPGSGCPARAVAAPLRQVSALAQLRMPELTIADIEQAEADALKYRYE